MIFDTEPTKKQLITGYLMAGLPLLFGFYMVVWGFGQMADKKAQNPENLISGCMYYDGTTRTKHGDKYHHLIIDDTKTDTLKAYTSKFNQHIKTKGFNHIGEFDDYIENNKRYCHKISYIKLDFFLFNKVFVYDYHGSS